MGYRVSGGKIVAGTGTAQSCEIDFPTQQFPSVAQHQSERYSQRATEGKMK